MPFSIVFRIAKFYSSEFLVYPLETLALISRRIFTVGLLLLFWHLVARDNDIQGLQIVPYILIASGAQFLTVGQNFRQAHEISEDIKYGRMNNLLIRPVNELRYELGAYLGKNVFEYAFSTINILLGLWFVSGLDAARLGLFVLSLVPALTIGYALNVAVAAVAFWLVEITYFRLLTYFMLRIVSGMFLPLTFFTGAWAALQYAPTAQLAFVPSYIITGDDLGKAATLVVAGCIQAPIMLFLANAFWKKGLRRYGAVGI
jgi:ABC-2 type transport system permease protein